MSEDLTPLQLRNIEDAAVKAYKSEKIVEYDLDLSNWEIDVLYKDSLWVQLLDEPDAHTVKGKDSLLYIPVATQRGLYRFARVIKCGQEVKYAKEGQFIRFPSIGVGAPYEQTHDGFKTYIIRETDVMAVVKYVGSSTPEQDIQEKVVLANINK